MKEVRETAGRCEDGKKMCESAKRRAETQVYHRCVERQVFCRNMTKKVLERISIKRVKEERRGEMHHSMTRRE